jgi:hypothetical protein
MISVVRTNAASDTGDAESNPEVSNAAPTHALNSRRDGIARPNIVSAEIERLVRRV